MLDDTLTRDAGSGAGSRVAGPTPGSPSGGSAWTPLQDALVRPRPRSTGRASRRLRLTTVLAGVDAAALLVAALLGGLLVGGAAAGSPAASWSPVAVAGVLLAGVAGWLLCLGLSGAWRGADTAGLLTQARRVLRGAVAAAGLLGVAAYVLRLTGLEGTFLVFLAVGVTLHLAVRAVSHLVLIRLRRQGRWQQRALVVGSRAAVEEGIDALERVPAAGFRVVGICGTPGFDDAGWARSDSPLLGGVDDVALASDAVAADVVLVAGGTDAATVRRLTWQLEGTEVQLTVLPGLVDVAGGRLQLDRVGGLGLLHVGQPRWSAARGWAKRAFDAVAAAALLALLSPLLATIAVALRLQDGGPVLYRQYRQGQGGRMFAMYKFRSMRTDADEQRARLRDQVAPGQVLFKLSEDPRITPLGALLRRFSLDELPQLLNVLRGDMSLVGPRPPLPEEVAQYPAEMHRRLLVRPGLTGLWQVSGRSDLPFEEAVRLDLDYVDNWSFGLDLALLARTCRAVVGGEGAY